jgi:peptide-methionine (S)-S-oxide reductase
MSALRTLAGAMAVTIMVVTTAAVASQSQPTADAPAGLAKATFAGGCFWCMEHPFDELPGVISVTSGYTGGATKNPTYEQVSSGTTGHAESVEIVYDPKRIMYEKLVDVFWHNVDPLDGSGQFCDHGTQYRSAIFSHDETQKQLAEQSKKRLEESRRLNKPILTQIAPASTFWRAEDYHQHYYKKNPLRYRFYRHNCGRDRRLQELWGSDHLSLLKTPAAASAGTPVAD